MAGAALPPDVRVTYRQQYRRCGKATCSRCAAGEPGHGPYWYAYWREEGRSRSRYVGRHPPAEGSAGPAVQLIPLAPLRVRTLGGFAVWRGATLIPPAAWTSRRATALFKCLLSAPGHRLPREQLAEFLWPDGEPGAGAANLRTAIHLLRRVLDAPTAMATYLHSAGNLLALVPGGVAEPPDDWLDAAAFARAASGALAGRDAAACRAALALYGGEYLPDDVYAAWAAPMRETLRRQYIDLLLHLAGLSEEQAELEETEECLQRVLAAEPSHEAAAARLMMLLAAMGRRSAALRIYHRLATVLEEELDVAPAAEIMALRAQLLAQEASPVAAREAPREGHAGHLSNLPAPSTSLVGRGWETVAVAEALTSSRLVTLTGPGGCGKTRLALHVAARLVDAYAQGVWLVELAALADPAFVPLAVATAVGLHEEPGQPLSATLAAALRPRQVLLVLDNCEHLVEACASVAAMLLRTCLEVRILATSREALRVDGEATWRVSSLAVPESTHVQALEELGRVEAVHLFVERAQAVQPHFGLTAHTAPAVAELCRRLDGLPLAIELAAARVRGLSVAALVARLDQRFRLLTGGSPTALPRQQTLRATLDWSYELLSAPEQSLFARLSVFAGSFTLDAMEAVCAGGAVPAEDTLDLFMGLVEKSLVVAEESRGDINRYRMLETVRQYGRDRWIAAAAGDDLNARHASYYRALVEQSEQSYWGPGRMAWLDRLTAEDMNIRQALRWALGAGAAQEGLRLAGALMWYWAVRGYMGEGQQWLAALLALPEAAARTPARAKALFVIGILRRSMGPVVGSSTVGTDTHTLIAEAADVARETGDRWTLALALANLGGWTARTDQARGRAMMEESLVHFRDLDGPVGLDGAQGVMNILGDVAWEQGDTAAARTWWSEGLAQARATGDQSNVAMQLSNLGMMAYHEGAHATARQQIEECLTIRRSLHQPMAVALALRCLGAVARAQGDTPLARSCSEETLAFWQASGDRAGIAATLCDLGALAQQEGRPAQARSMVEEALRLRREVGDTAAVAASLAQLGGLHLVQGDWGAAVRLYREGLDLVRTAGPRAVAASCLEGLAALAQARGRVHDAARLYGAAATLRQGTFVFAVWDTRTARDEQITAARQALGEAAFAAAWAKGQAMTLEEARSFALQGLPASSSKRARAT